jgi:hypothetical protein
MTIQPSDIGARRFAHQAMATEFEIFCVHQVYEVPPPGQREMYVRPRVEVRGYVAKSLWDDLREMP